MTWYYGDKYIANDSLKDGVWVQSEDLLQAGLQTGDKIISIDGKKVERANELPYRIMMGQEMVVNRNGAEVEIGLPVDILDKINSKREKGVVAPRIPLIVSAVPDDSQNKDVFKQGDFIIALNGTKIEFADQFKAETEKYKDETITAVIKRDEKELEVPVKIDNEGKIGIAFPLGIKERDAERLGLFSISQDNYSLVESVPVGVNKGIERLVDYGQQLKKIVKPETGAYKGVGGFYAIFNVFPDSWSWEAFWEITALLSIMLGVMNLLPIPALDGGHVMFLLYEMISGRKPSDKFMEYAQTVGFLILIALLLFANGNDIFKAITGK